VIEPGIRGILSIFEFVFETFALFRGVGEVIVLVLDAWAHIAALVIASDDTPLFFRSVM
jgi:hypothetical protein